MYNCGIMYVQSAHYLEKKHHRSSHVIQHIEQQYNKLPKENQIIWYDLLIFLLQLGVFIRICRTE